MRRPAKARDVSSGEHCAREDYARDDCARDVGVADLSEGLEVDKKPEESCHDDDVEPDEMLQLAGLVGERGLARASAEPGPADRTRLRLGAETQPWQRSETRSRLQPKTRLRLGEGSLGAPEEDCWAFHGLRLLGGPDTATSFPARFAESRVRSSRLQKRGHTEAGERRTRAQPDMCPTR